MITKTYAEGLAALLHQRSEKFSARLITTRGMLIARDIEIKQDSTRVTLYISFPTIDYDYIPAILAVYYDGYLLYTADIADYYPTVHADVDCALVIPVELS